MDPSSLASLFGGGGGGMQTSTTDSGANGGAGYFANTFGSGGIHFGSESSSSIGLYVAIGALNIEKLNGEQVIYSSIKPTQAAKLLNCDSKKIARWCVALCKKGFLIRDWGGAYKVANINVWFEISKLVNKGRQDGEPASDALPESLILAMSDPAFLAARETPVQVRDR